MKALREVLALLITISSLQVECVIIPQIWNRILAASITEPTNKPPKQIFEYKGFKFHPTENYPYPTTPAGDKEFEKWEQEQERLYAEEILAKLSSPNDTQLQHETKALIANFLVHVAVDNATNSNQISNDRERGYPQEEIQSPETLPSSNSNDYNVQTQNVLEQPPPPPQILPPPVQATGGFNPIESIQSILSIISQNNRNNDTGAISPFTAILNRFSPQQRRTPSPNATTEYYIVPIRPSTEANAISLHQKDLGNKVERLRENVNKRNISGVLDESLQIASIQTIGVLITGFLDLLLCNPVDRWNGNCDP